jgi:flagellar M-ring protein FliF
VIDRLRTLSPARQLVIAVLGVIALTALLIGLWMALRTPYHPLFTSLKTADAAAIVGELERRKLPYRLADDGSTILVPADRVDATRLDLMNGNLSLKGTVGFELFNKSDMGFTDFAQRINYQRALQGELERTIMTLEGVDSARVHLSLGEDRIFREDRVPPKASVTVHMRQGAVLAASVSAGLQRLVAAAVPQLQPEDVVILDDAGEVISGGRSTQQAYGSGNDEERAIGEYYAARIRTALQKLYAAKVNVSVRAIRPAGIDPAVDSPHDASWNPQARDFPLQVTLDPEPLLSASARQDIESLASNAIGFDGARGDTISFGAVAERENAPAAPASARGTWSAPTIGQPPISVSGTGMRIWPLVIGAGLLAGLLLLIAKIRARPRPLSASERAKIIGRLTSLLDAEEANNAIRP